jgi:hypothetical protein
MLLGKEVATVDRAALNIVGEVAPQGERATFVRVSG